MRPLPLAGAVLVAGYVARRWRTLSTERRLLALVVVAALASYGAGAFDLPNVEKTIEDVGEALGQWTYLLVGVMAFLETGAFVGLLVPGETTIIVGGVVAGQGEIDVVLLIGLVWACAVAGDVTSYAIGRRLGRDFMLAHGPKVKITAARLEQVERFYDRHGGKAILLGRFVGLVRAVSPFIAGASRLPFGRFLPYDIIGCGIWGAAFVLIGYASWRSFDRAAEIAGRGAFALGTVIVVVVGGIVAYRFFREPVNRHRTRQWLNEQAERPLLRPVAGVARPVYRRVARPFARRVSGPLRFAWQRVTPGQLGLELTTLLAVALVGGFLFGATASLIADQPVIDGDRRAFEIAEEARNDTLVDLAKVVTDLGATAVLAPLTALVALWLAVRRRWPEAATLVVAFPLTVVAVNVAKAAEERPRPVGGLVATDGWSFPSGHAAYAVVLVALAVVVVRGLVGRFGLVVAGIAAAAAIGLSRVYLRAHFLSDVVAGWALGAAVFATCAMVALVVAFLRDNVRPP